MQILVINYKNEITNKFSLSRKTLESDQKSSNILVKFLVWEKCLVRFTMQLNVS